MKKIFVWMIVILIVTGLVGCENSAITKDEMWDDDSVNKKTTQSENMSSFISLTSKITELESGLSAVRFDGDYAFSLFLEQGGRGIGSGCVSVYKPITAQRKRGSSNAG